MAKEIKKDEHFRGTGRRKNAIARVRVKEGKGKIEVNNMPAEEYFNRDTLMYVVTQPIKAVELEGKLDIVATVKGGGTSGQAGAVCHGIARALIELNPDLRPALKKAGLLTRDPRMKERKKYGLKKARKAPQFSKR